MSTITYTREAPKVDSSFIEDILYNEDTKELFVSVRGDWYGYQNVPENVYNDFVTAYSLGRYYRTFKTDYGPGVNYGWSPEFMEQSNEGEVPVTTVNNFTQVVEPQDAVEVEFAYEVTYSVNGEEYTATVNAPNDVSAVQRLENSFDSLGMKSLATLLRVSRNL